MEHLELKGTSHSSSDLLKICVKSDVETLIGFTVQSKKYHSIEFYNFLYLFGRKHLPFSDNHLWLIITAGWGLKCLSNVSINYMNRALKDLCDPTFKRGTQSKSMALSARPSEPQSDQYTSAPQRPAVFRHIHTTYIDRKGWEGGRCLVLPTWVCLYKWLVCNLVLISYSWMSDLLWMGWSTLPVWPFYNLFDNLLMFLSL